MPGGTRPKRENIEFVLFFFYKGIQRLGWVNLKMPGVNLKMPGGARPKRENIEFVLFFTRDSAFRGGEP